MGTQKGDIKYNNINVRRLGPAANCPPNAKTPPKLKPQQGGGGGGQQNPTNPPQNPTKPPQTQAPITTKPVVTAKPCTTPGKCTCSPRTITKTGLPGAANGNILTYPITVAQSSTGGQKISVACSANTGKWYLYGGGCAAYPKCSTIQGNPAPVCTTGRYNPNAADAPCTSFACKADAATCCIGSQNSGGSGNNGGNNGGGGSSGAYVCTASPNSCIGFTLYNSQGG